MTLRSWGRLCGLAVLAGILLSVLSYLPDFRRPSSALSGVLFHGCDEVHLEGRCALDEEGSGVLSIWVPWTLGSTVALHISSVKQNIPPLRVEGGLRFKVKLDALPATLEVSRTTGRDRKAWSLPLIRTEELPDGLRIADQLRAEGRFDETRRKLGPLRQHPNPQVRARAVGRMARVALSEGRPYPEVVPLFEESIQRAADNGLVKMEIEDRCTLAYVQTNRGQYARALETLKPIAHRASLHPSAVKLARYYDGIIGKETGDLRRALEAAHVAHQTADRLGLPRWWGASASLLIQLHIKLDRREEAEQLIASAEARVPRNPSCRRAGALDQIGQQLMALHGSADHLARAGAKLREAALLYASTCPQPRRHAYTLTRLGVLRTLTSNYEEARAFLVASRAAQNDVGLPLRFGRLELEAELALLTGEFQHAAHLYRRLWLYARQAGNAGDEWLGLVGWGRALKRGEQWVEAAEVFQRAEQLLDRIHPAVPVGSGRSGFFRRHDESARHLVDVLIRLGRKRDALLAIRRSQRRPLVSLAVRGLLDAAPPPVRRRWFRKMSEYQQLRRAEPTGVDHLWSLSVVELERLETRTRGRIQEASRLLEEALSTLGSWAEIPAHDWEVESGTLLLGFHPIDRGWAGFSVSDRGTKLLRLEDVDLEGSPTQLGTQLLAPFAAELRSARRVQLALPGTMAQLDVHVLPFDGEPLLWHKPVTYRVDAGGLEGFAAPPPSTRSPLALVVAPNPDLATSRDEARLVSTTLREFGWITRALVGPPHAFDLYREMGASRGLDWFHFAGHARAAGLDGWQSVLGTPVVPQLTLGDILTLPRAPRQVVLSACETVGVASGAGFGLGQAFVLSGARSVVAATRPVTDEDASIVVKALYEELEAASFSVDAGAALRSALLRIRRQHPEVDWRGFVHLTP
ncbi:MAG: CHAT domain-containing protein [Myxococcota bacterium]